MNISIIGAAGEVGRSLATNLLRGGLMTTTDELQLLGHGVEGTERMVLAERVDLLDAFDEMAPRIEVAATPKEVIGNIVVMTPRHGSSGRWRGRWGRAPGR
jgi:malate dehydrogenase